MTGEQMGIQTVTPGDTVEFVNAGDRFGGVVWRDTVGNLWAGDTAIFLNGRWLPNSNVSAITRKESR